MHNDCESQDIIYILFLYFLIVRKSIRTVKKENDGINGNKEISFGSELKNAFLHFSVTCIYLYIQMRNQFLIRQFAKGPWHGLVHLQTFIQSLIFAYCEIDLNGFKKK